MGGLSRCCGDMCVVLLSVLLTDVSLASSSSEGDTEGVRSSQTIRTRCPRKCQ